MNAYEIKAGIGVIAGKTVWSMPEHLECQVLPYNKALYKYTYLYLSISFDMEEAGEAVYVHIHISTAISKSTYVAHSLSCKSGLLCQ